MVSVGFDLRTRGNVHTACYETELGANVKVGDNVGRILGEGQVWACRCMMRGVRVRSVLDAIRGKANVIHLELVRELVCDSIGMKDGR